MEEKADLKPRQLSADHSDKLSMKDFYRYETFKDDNYRRDPLTARVIGCAIEVHRVLGPGLLESAYESCLAKELKSAEVPFARQVPVPIDYKGSPVECGYRIDLLVADRLVVELKCVESITNVHRAQILTYMKLLRIQVGLILNFNVTLLKSGIHRLILSSAS